VYDVESGQTLADALRKHPRRSATCTSTWSRRRSGRHPGHHSGSLGGVLEKNDAIVRKVKGAMIYPAVILSVAAIAISVLLIFVIPTFQNMFASVNCSCRSPPAS